jgi:hypothetical protein
VGGKERRANRIRESLAGESRTLDKERVREREEIMSDSLAGESLAYASGRKKNKTI